MELSGSARVIALGGKIRGAVPVEMDSGLRFTELADTAPVMIWRAGPDKQLNYVNQPWLEFTGRSFDDEMGDGWLSAVHEDDRVRCVAIYTTAFDNRQSFTMEYRLRRADGQYRWIIDNGRPFFRSEGDFAGYLGSCIDITERKEAELRATQALAEAQRALRQRDVLLAEVHHRVKNNLQVILSLLALKARHTPDCAPVLESVGRRVQAIAIIQQELHEDVDVSEIDLQDYVRRLATALAELHGAAGTVRIDGETVAFDLPMAGIVGLILSELLSNAFQHGRDGIGSIAVTLEGATAQQRTAIRISDAGPGLGAIDRWGDQGIGLHLVRKLVRQSGLELTLDTGPGTAWRLVVPWTENGLDGIDELRPANARAEDR